MFSELSEIVTDLPFSYSVPSYSRRESWNGISAECREFIISTAEKYLGYVWPTPPASLYLDYFRNGNRSRYESIIFNGRRLPLLYLVFAECFEGKGRFTDDIINGVWSTLDESSWVAPAHNEGNPLPDFEKRWVIDLFSAECSAILSFVLYELGDLLDSAAPQITSRIRLTLDRKIFTPFIENNYWWTGLDNSRIPNNWNPWIISNILISVYFAFLGEEKTKAVLKKCLACLDKFVEYYAPDGGCDEGPCYWAVATGSLFDCMDVLYDMTGGKADLYGNELVRNMCSYIYKMHIDGRYFVCYADADAKTDADAHLIYRMGKRTGDGNLIRMAGASYREIKKNGNIYDLDGCEAHIYRNLGKFFCDGELAQVGSDYPFISDVWFGGIQVMACRCCENSPKGIFLSAKGGNNGESHNHNDVGSFIIYCDGLPAIIDIGRGEYVKQTFSDRRYEILQMQSGYHNLPVIGDVTQKDGREYEAVDTVCEKLPNGASLKMDLRGAYPAEAGIISWKRKFTLDRDSKTVSLNDSFSLTSPQKIQFVFITSVKPEFAGNTMILGLNDETSLTMTFDASLTPSSEVFDTSRDERLSTAWGSCVYRVILNTHGKCADGDYFFRFSQDSGIE